MKVVRSESGRNHVVVQPGDQFPEVPASGWRRIRFDAPDVDVKLGPWINSSSGNEGEWLTWGIFSTPEGTVEYEADGRVMVPTHSLVDGDSWVCHDFTWYAWEAIPGRSEPGWVRYEVARHG